MSRKYSVVLSILLVFALAFLNIGSAMAAVGTNQGDYPPGSVVTISGDNSDGAGYAAGETIHVDANGPNSYTLSCDAVADNAGAWSCGLALAADAPIGDYSYTATGLTSNVSQSGAFTVSSPSTATETPVATESPTAEPTQEPTQPPTVEPTASPTSEPTSSAPPTIASDLADYNPGQLVTLTGANWQGDTTIIITVVDAVPTVYHNTDQVQVQADGTISDSFNLPDTFVDQYFVTATGTQTGRVATTTFTDASGTKISNITTTASGAYEPGSTLSFTVNFVNAAGTSTANETVNTTNGTPSIALNSGGTAYYSGGTGSPNLVFTYTVGEGESATRLNYTGTAIVLNGGTIRNGIGSANNAILTLPTIASGNDGIYNGNIIIDPGSTVSSLTVTPSPTNTAPAINATISNSFSTVTQAEYFVNSPGTPGTGTALTIASSGVNTWSATGTMTSTAFNALTQGTRTVYVDAKDAYGIWGPMLSQTFVKDTVGPVVPVFSILPNITNTAPTITVNNLPDGSGVAAAEYWVDNSSGVAGTGTPLTVTPLNGTSVTATGTLTNFSSLTDGTHTVYVDAQDTLGNWSAAKRSATFTKDTQPPVVTVLTASPITATALSPSFSMTITDNKSIAGAEYFIDTAGAPGSGTAISVSGTTTASTQFGLSNFASISDGPHTFIVEAKDGAGNWSATKSVGFIKDSQIPSVTLSSLASATNNSPLNFTATFSVPVSGIDPGKVTVTGGSLGAITGGPTIYTIPVNPTNNPSSQAGDQVSVQLQAGAAQSEANNYLGVPDPSLASSLASATFDNLAPLLTAADFQSSAFGSPYPVGTVLVPTSTSIYLNLTFNENVVITGSLVVHLNNGMTLGNGYFSTGNHNLVTFYGTIPSGVTPTNGVALDFASGTPFTGGTLTDAATNAVSIPTLSSTDILSSQNIQVHATDDVPPVTTAATVNNNYQAISPNAAGWFNASTVYVTLSATDLGSGVAHIYYMVDNGTQGTYLTTHVPVTGNGTHTVTYWSVDNAGNTEAHQTLTIKIDTSAPVITLNPVPNGTYGTPYTITGTWSEPISGLATSSPFTVYLYDYVDHYSFITVGTITSPSFVVNSNGTWSFTFIPTDAVWSNSVQTPVENSNWVITVSAVSGAGVGSNSVTSNSGGNIKYTCAPTAVFTSSQGGGAVGTGILTNGFVTGVNITNGGSGYSQTSPPVVTFTGCSGFNATGIAIVDSNGHVTGVNMNMVTIVKATPVIQWSNPADITYGTALSGTQLNATANVLGTFVYTPAAGTVLNPGSGQTLHVDFTPTDTTNYNNASKDVTINVLKVNQTISFAALANKTYGDPDFTVSATASSGLAVTFTVSGNCTVAGSTVHITGAGSCTVTSHQAGNNYFNSAPDVSRTFTIAKADQTISFAALGNKTYGDLDFSVSATASSSLAVTFTASGACTVSGSTVHITGAGNCTITAHQAGDGNYNAAPDVSRTFTINKATLTVTPNNQSHQYSDPVPTLTYTFSGFMGSDGSSVVTGAPTCTTTGTQLAAPGSYPITCTSGTLSAANYTFQFVAGTMTVTPEDARSYYTGNSLFWGATTTATSANVALAATIKDITAVTGDPAYDAFAGDIRNARVTFVNRDGGNAALSGCSNLTVALVSPSDTTVGTVTCNTTLSIGSSGGSQYNIGIVASYYYTDNTSGEDFIVTVAQPLTSSFITGGGYLLESSSAGQYAGDSGSKSNFGFNVKYNKSGTNLQGNVNIIIRKGTKVYQIKSTSLTSLGTSPCTQATSTSPCTANFTSKATLTDITDPNNPISLGGNLTLQMLMTDKGEPGSSDTIAFALYDSSSKLLFSSKWNGTKTVEQLLGGGNLVVH